MQHLLPSGRYAGYRPDLPDFRDVYFRDTAYQVGLASTDSDWRSRIEAPWDQGELGSCVAHGVGSLVRYVYPDLMPSRLKLYYDGRVIEKTVREDSGLEVRDGIKAIVGGVCPEAMWPYAVKKFKTKPSPDCYARKNERLITRYARVGKTPDDAGSVLDEMLNCLGQGSPIVFGTTLYASFESDAVAKSGRVPMPGRRERVLGGHCMAVFGARLDDQVFIVRNSWGTDWADQGYCYIPFDYLVDKNLTSDLWMVTK